LFFKKELEKYEKEGSKIVFFGRVNIKNSKITMIQPKFEKLSTEYSNILSKYKRNQKLELKGKFHIK
jgi:hypothetical protein